MVVLPQFSLGFVFQAFNLIPALTAAENVTTPLIINGMKPRAAVEQARGVLQKVGLDDSHDALDADGSVSGQQQRVAIARALVQIRD